MWTVPPLQKAETELQLVGPVSRRRHGDRSTWVFQSAGCSVEPIGAADALLHITLSTEITLHPMKIQMRRMSRAQFLELGRLED